MDRQAGGSSQILRTSGRAAHLFAVWIDRSSTHFCFEWGDQFAALQLIRSVPHDSPNVKAAGNLGFKPQSSGIEKTLPLLEFGYSHPIKHLAGVKDVIGIEGAA